MDKAALLAKRMPQRDVEIPDVGTVKVRGMSRAETLECQKVAGDAGALERKALFFALVDPKLSEDEAAEWYDSATFAELEPVLLAIQELSGIAEGAGKSGVQGV